jgi:uncharacterized protein
MAYSGCVMMTSGRREIDVVVSEDHARTTAVIYPAAASTVAPNSTLVLAHGAGADQRSRFMTMFADGLSGEGVDVVTFNFLYTEKRRRVPDRMPRLVACYRSVMSAVQTHLPSARECLFIGGKSMGGRAATHVAAEDRGLPICGIVLLGYPLHPPGRPDERRDAHLADIQRPMLFVQGSRDTFGTPAELQPVLEKLSPPPALHVVDHGDHSFKVGRESAKQLAVYREIQRRIVEWMRAITAT